MAKCPYCDKPVLLKAGHSDEDREIRRESCGVAKKEIMYSCPHCDRVLGFGFFVGGWLTGRP